MKHETTMDKVRQRLQDTHKEWCLVRWSEGHFCGPLSPCWLLFTEGLGALGFPHGEIGDVMCFGSEEEALETAKQEQRNPEHRDDRPIRLSDLAFKLEAYEYYDGSKEVIASGSYDVVRAKILETLGALEWFELGKNGIKLSIRAHIKEPK